MKLTENKSSKSLNATLYSPDPSGSNHVEKKSIIVHYRNKKGGKEREKRERGEREKREFEEREERERERERERETERERQRERDREREEGSAGAGLIMSEGIKSSRN